jgi:hypothetical protein
MIHFEITAQTKVLNLLFTPDEDVVIADGEVNDVVVVFDHLYLLVSECVWIAFNVEKVRFFMDVVHFSVIMTITNF